MYGFLFAFHRNCGSLLYHFQDSLRDWPKIEIFHIHAFDAPPPIRGPHRSTPIRGPHRSIAVPFGVEKLEWCGKI